MDANFPTNLLSASSKPALADTTSGGGLSPNGARWISCRPSFFLPVRVVSRVFRRLFLEGLTAMHDAAGRLAFHGDVAHLAEASAFAALLAPCAAPAGSSTPPFAEAAG
jgi:hypothetical protein